MGRSDEDYRGGNLMDDNDTLHLYNEIKELLRASYNTFDDLLQKMGKPEIAKEN